MCPKKEPTIKSHSKRDQFIGCPTSHLPSASYRLPLIDVPCMRHLTRAKSVSLLCTLRIVESVRHSVNHHRRMLGTINTHNVETGGWAGKGRSVLIPLFMVRTRVKTGCARKRGPTGRRSPPAYVTSCSRVPEKTHRDIGSVDKSPASESVYQISNVLSNNQQSRTPNSHQDSTLTDFQ